MKKRDTVSLIYKNFGYSGSVILFMDLPPPAEQTLPETPPAIVTHITTATNDVGERFQKLTAEIFEQGLIANKTEEELIQMTAQLVLMILAERAFNMTPDIMNPYFAIKERIIAEKKKKEPEIPVTETIETQKTSRGVKIINWLLRRKIA